MTSNDFTDIFRKDPTPLTVAKLLYHTIVEANQMLGQLEDTQAKTAILKEAEQEWRGFARLCPEVKPEALKWALHHTVPESKELLP